MRCDCVFDMLTHFIPPCDVHPALAVPGETKVGHRCNRKENKSGILSASHHEDVLYLHTKQKV